MNETVQLIGWLAFVLIATWLITKDDKITIRAGGGGVKEVCPKCQRSGTERDTTFAIKECNECRSEYEKTHTLCDYCREPIADGDLTRQKIFSRNWKHQGFQSPLRNYHRSKGCAGNDQMAHEG